MANFFISDLHLEPTRPEVVELFTNFLKTISTSLHTLYILGDLFEVWIGDDDNLPFHQNILTALKNATENGLTVFFIHGNRDFLIGKKFFRETGCRELPEKHVINIDNQKILLMHGDLLCTQDVSYLQFRKRTRKWWVKKLFLLKSLETRRKIADNMRTKSKEYTSTAPDYIMDVTQKEVEDQMKKNHVQFLVHGHTHREAIHEFTHNNQKSFRYVLGAWHEHGSVLVWENNMPRFEKLT